MAKDQERRETLTFRQRFDVHRAARADARHGLPTPSLNGFVTTPFRDELRDRHDTAIEQCHERYLRTEADTAVRVEQIDRETTSLRARLAAAEDDLAAAIATGVDETQRRRGDEHAAGDLVARRRRREYENTVRGCRDACALLDTQLTELERRRDEYEREGRRQAIAAGTDARTVHFSTLALRDAYDRVLLHRHPQRALVEASLDTGIWKLPHWLDSTHPETAGAAGAEAEEVTAPGATAGVTPPSTLTDGVGS